MADLSRLEDAVHHLSLMTTADHDAVIDFYGGIMGLSQVNEVKINQDLLIYYKIAGNLKLEIIITPDIPNGNPEDSQRQGFAHFAFTVDDVDLWYKKIIEAGLEVTYGPEIINELNINTFLFRDPFGAVWELMEETE